MHTYFPQWLHIIATVSLLLGAVCGLIIVLDEIRRPQKMTVMNFVWPLTAMFGSVLWLAAYCRWGRANPDSRGD